MLYGTPTRVTHRATAGGGLALPLRTGGQHRVPARRPEPQRTAHLVVQGLAAMIVLGLTTLIGSFIVADAQRALDSTPHRAVAGGLDSRALDDDPLTLQEVFPDRRTLTAPAAPGTYRIGITHADSDCRTAATGALGGLLAEHGCSQVVRAAMSAPYGDYQVTAGVFNLADAAGAEDVDGRLRLLVETGDGNFATLPAANAAATQHVGWRAHGHYLLYCVITRPDGQLVSGDDPNAARITADLVDDYLGQTVLERRSARV